jgi:hypothetical protein
MVQVKYDYRTILPLGTRRLKGKQSKTYNNNTRNKKYNSLKGRTLIRRASGRKFAYARVLASSKIVGTRATGMSASLS